MKRFSRLTGFCLLIASTILATWLQPSAAAQAVPARGGWVVRGDVVSSSPVYDSLTVELAADGAAAGERAAVNTDGSFEFHFATPGTHEIRVITAGGTVIHREFVSITGSGQNLSVRLPETQSANRSSESTVSMQQLQHKVPARAQKAYAKGETFIRKNNWSEALECFRQAVTIDPEFADAHNEFGAAYASLNRLPEAAEQFQKAIDLVPEHRLALPNLSIVLAKMKKFHDAGAVARRALRVAPADSRVHYILAVSLMVEHGDQAEVLDNLQRASAEVPKAHLLAADMLAKSGRQQEAAQQLEAYLDAVPAQDSERSKVEAELARLQQKPEGQ
jgi:Flp pilus assembly protein TadD